MAHWREIKQTTVARASMRHTLTRMRFYRVHTKAYTLATLTCARTYLRTHTRTVYILQTRTRTHTDTHTRTLGYGCGDIRFLFINNSWCRWWRTRYPVTVSPIGVRNHVYHGSADVVRGHQRARRPHGRARVHYRFAVLYASCGHTAC